MTWKIGVLLTSKGSDEQIGVIEFDPSGMLISRMIKRGLHPYTLRPVTELLPEQLYQKHAGVIEEKGSLPSDVLYDEAEKFADTVNRKGMEVRGIPVRASAIYWQEPTEQQAK